MRFPFQAFGEKVFSESPQPLQFVHPNHDQVIGCFGRYLSVLPSRHAVDVIVLNGAVIIIAIQCFD